MYRRIADFENVWAYETESTLKLLRVLTDESLSQAVGPQGRTLGRLAWHIAITPREMLARTGLTPEGPDEHAPVPFGAAAIVSAYEATARAVAEQVKSAWTDATLELTDEMYGERWARGTTLHVLVTHQTHHRGQLTVLMRQAGLVVPGVYGPAREEWAAFGAPAPEI